jgi:hypothetical protein
MNNLREALNDYLALRQVLGYKLIEDGKVLAQFLTFVEQAGAEHIITELAMQWTTGSLKASPAR